MRLILSTFLIVFVGFSASGDWKDISKHPGVASSWQEIFYSPQWIVDRSSFKEKMGDKTKGNMAFNGFSIFNACFDSDEGLYRSIEDVAVPNCKVASDFDYEIDNEHRSNLAGHNLNDPEVLHSLSQESFYVRRSCRLWIRKAMETDGRYWDCVRWKLVDKNKGKGKGTEFRSKCIKRAYVDFPRAQMIDVYRDNDGFDGHLLEDGDTFEFKKKYVIPNCFAVPPVSTKK